MLAPGETRGRSATFDSQPRSGLNFSTPCKHPQVVQLLQSCQSIWSAFPGFHPGLLLLFPSGKPKESTCHLLKRTAAVVHPLSHEALR